MIDPQVEERPLPQQFELDDRASTADRSRFYWNSPLSTARSSGPPASRRPARSAGSPTLRQKPPLPVAVELARGVGEDPDLARRLEERLREALVFSAAVELVPWGTLQRSEYKSKLVER